MQRHTSARISLKLKPVASHVEEDIEYFGKEGDDEDDESDGDDQVWRSGCGGLTVRCVVVWLWLFGDQLVVVRRVVVRRVAVWRASYIFTI